MPRHPTDISTPEPDIKYLCEDICEAYQEGIAVWDERVQTSLIGDGLEVPVAEELRNSLERSWKEIARVYMGFYKQAGAHFAIGDDNGTTKTVLAAQLKYLDTKVIRVLQDAPDEALAGIPWIPGSFFARYNIIHYDLLHQQSDHVCTEVVNSLQTLFSDISAWAVPIHTLPPLATSTTSLLPSEHEAESFFERLRAPFHRQRFQYDKLPKPYSFRLVRILTAKPYVTCEIATFDLVADPPPFRALSYTWGTSTQRADIWCNDVLLQVSPNLKKGLQQLHKYGAWSTTRWFWIDQVCINQGDLDERMNQVRLMRAIYQRAQHTVIWLGPDETSTPGAFSLIGELYLLSVEAQKREIQGGRPDAIMREGFPTDTDERWQHLARFLDLPWFARCWIIQEVVVSPGDPVLLCGSFQILWSRFTEAIEALLRYRPGFRADRVGLIKGILDLSSKSDVWELASLLQSTRPFQATDPRDKIFALLGLSGESRTPEKWPRALIPDYNRSTRDVYTAVTLYCIERTNSLSILSQAGHSSSSYPESTSKTPTSDTTETAYPSWVPRWWEPPLAAPLSAFEPSHSRAGWKLLTEKHHAASLSHGVSRSTHVPPGVLRLEGVRIAQAVSCLPVVTPSSDSAGSTSDTSSSTTTTMTDKDLYATMMAAIPNLLALARAQLPHASADDFLRTFFVVTTAGLTPEKTDAHYEPLDHFRAFLQLATAAARAKKGRKSAGAEAASSSRGVSRHAYTQSQASTSSSTSTSTLTPSKEDGVDFGNPTYSLHHALHALLPSALLSPTLSPPLTRHSSSSSSLPLSPPSPSLSTSSSLTLVDSTAPADPTRYTTSLTPLLHRRLFTTADGRLGLGPRAMMSGDVVVVLFGGRVPFVLREQGREEWRMVGECFLEGAMGGEGLLGGEGEGAGWWDLV